MYAPDGAFCVWHEKEKAAYGEAALRGAYEEAPLLRTTVNVRGRLGLAKKTAGEVGECAILGGKAFKMSMIASLCLNANFECNRTRCNFFSVDCHH